jgi:hypothetical protein
VNELLPLLTVAWGRTPNGAQAGRPFAYDEQAVFEHCVGAIVRSMDGNERRAWHRFYDNSLAALERAMAEPAAPPDFIGPFGAIYRQLMALVRGRTLLDAGTCFGFLPLLLARQGQARPDSGRRLLDAELTQIVGCDLEGALIDFATAYAADQRYAGVRFKRADLLADDFARLGAFDTVTAIHVLEHLEYSQTSAVLANLWAVTARRLIVAVPIEQRPDQRFGHRQIFTEASLLGLGRELGGRCRTFTLHGGWLIVDKDVL